MLRRCLLVLVLSTVFGSPALAQHVDNLAYDGETFSFDVGIGEGWTAAIVFIQIGEDQTIFDPPVEVEGSHVTMGIQASPPDGISVGVTFSYNGVPQYSETPEWNWN